MSAGYSDTPLLKKLGIKAGFRAAIVNPPEDYEQTLGVLPPGVTRLRHLEAGLDFIQFFTNQQAELEAHFDELKGALAQNGMLWISWPKKPSPIPSDLDENIIRQIGLWHGMVDVKVCAVDKNWSALKFVFRRKDRR